MRYVLESICGLEAPFNMIVLVILIACGTGVLTSGFKQMRKYFCHRHETELKRDLVERGLPVDEIERIVRARSVDKTQEV